MRKMNTLQLAHEWMQKSIQPGDLCIDATAGRGWDTVFLCELVGTSGKVLAFDIQEEAIKSTNQLLEEKGLHAHVVQADHRTIDEYVDQGSVAGMMFNFGYLPGGDHTICTQAQESIEAIEKGLVLLKQYGVMALCIYQGGDTGFEEKESIMSYLKGLDSKQYSVIVSEFYNRPNYPPIFVGIIKDRL